VLADWFPTLQVMISLLPLFVIVKPAIVWLAARFSVKHPPEHVNAVVDPPEVQAYAVVPSPPEQVMTVAPTMVRLLLPGSAMALDHEAEPAGTVIVSPLAAAVTQSFTSVRLALAASRLGLEPPHTASAVPSP
jgi:hypothetical protein